MKIKKLDMRGLTHDIMLVAFVAIFAIAGVAYLVASHADSCGPGLNQVSAPATKSRCAAAQVVCNFNGLPANPAHGEILRPTLTLNNTGKNTASVNVYVETLAFSTPTKGGSLWNRVHFYQKIGGLSQSVHTLKPYSIPYATKNVQYEQYSASRIANGVPQLCVSNTFKLPTKPAPAIVPAKPLT